jgi:two-component system, NtrC family, nitrogen regulation sensor histidine kinase NtrY
MGFNRFGALLTLRLAIILMCLAFVGFLVITPGYHAATLLVVSIASLLTYEVFRFVSKTNKELSRFLDAVRYADFGQRFQFTSDGAGFSELGDTFTNILERFRQDRKQQESELRHLKALLEHVPVPLISLHSDNRITLWNNSARRLFGIAQVTRQSDLTQFGDEFYRQVRDIQPGEKLLVTFQADDLEQQLTLSASEITIASSTERLISLNNIQTELDGVQLNAWQDLVRVLTHEIMNSITPVSSLAKTAVDLVDDISSKLMDKTELLEDLDDVKNAVNTVARRSDGLMNFVSSYRQLTRLPAPEKSRFQVSELFDDVTRMATLDWLNEELALITNVNPTGLDIFADRQMIEQVLINLLQNSEHALAEVDGGQVTLSARLNKRGHVAIEIADNGTGIAEEIISRVFVPFYTTRREGSGVGLALSRQVMLAHGGSITYSANEPVGARFMLIF